MILDSTGLPLLDKPPLISRNFGTHLVNTNIALVDYIAGCDNCLALVTATGAANFHALDAAPFISPPYRCTVDQIQFEVVTAQANTEAFIGLFENCDTPYALQMGDMPLPGRTLYKSGSVATTTTGLKASSISPAVELVPNRLYWLCLARTAAAVVPTFRSLQTGGAYIFGTFGTSQSMIGCLRSQSSTQAVLWDNFPIIPSAGWSSTVNQLVMRYRLAP